MSVEVGIVGLGLLGGSCALALRKVVGSEWTFVGHDLKGENACRAVDLGLVDRSSDLESIAATADFIFVATPVNSLPQVVSTCLDRCKDSTLVVDLGSTKASLCQALAQHPKRGNFLAGHPIAGTENSGPDAAFVGLFQHKTMIFCETEKTRPDLYQMGRKVFEDLSMRVAVMEDPAEHDLHLAFVSHLSHVSSFALGATVLDKEQDERSIFHMAGSGFSSTVRLAKSSPDMWAPIFFENKANVLEALKAYIEKLQQMQSLLANDQQEELHQLLSHSNDIRRVLLGIDKKSKGL